jgi:hypothetical protein
MRYTPWEFRNPYNKNLISTIPLYNHRIVNLAHFYVPFSLSRAFCTSSRMTSLFINVIHIKPDTQALKHYVVPQFIRRLCPIILSSTIDFYKDTLRIGKDIFLHSWICLIVKRFLTPYP